MPFIGQSKTKRAMNIIIPAVNPEINLRTRSDRIL